MPKEMVMKRQNECRSIKQSFIKTTKAAHRRMPGLQKDDCSIQI